MRITAISDTHGYLPKIEKTDLLLIAGDWSPLEIQTDAYFMKQWINDCLLTWFKETPADKIIFIAGNHDFICDDRFLEIPLANAPIVTFEKDILKPMLKKNKLTNKVTYLCNSSTKYNGLKIYGCPNVEGCRGWAFATTYVEELYAKIPKCDILITHQPPLFNNIAQVRNYKNNIVDFGSYSLLCAVKKSKPKLHFCGHIHEGNHEPQQLVHSENSVTTIINVSIKNEEYQPFYKQTVIDI